MPKMPKMKTLNLPWPKTIDEIVLPETSDRNANGAYDCLYCGKAIRRLYDVKRHVKDVHINDKQYKCVREGKGCDFAGANQKSNLTQHYKNSPLCNEARLIQEDDIEETTPEIKIETVSDDLFHHWQPTSATARASRSRTSKRSANKRAAPYSTAGRRGPPPSEASSSQSPHAHASYQAESYETLAMNNFFDQNFQAQAPALSDAFYQIPQSPVTQNNDFLSSPDANSLFMDDPFTTSPVQPEPLFLAPAVEPAPQFYTEPTPTFDCSNSSTNPSSSYRDGAVQELIAASRATGEINYVQAQDNSSSQINNNNSWLAPVDNSMALTPSGSSSAAPQPLDECFNFENFQNNGWSNGWNNGNFQNNGWNNENFQNLNWNNENLQNLNWNESLQNFDWNNGMPNPTEQAPAENLNLFSEEIFDWKSFLDSPMMNGNATDALAASTTPLSPATTF